MLKTIREEVERKVELCDICREESTERLLYLTRDFRWKDVATLKWASVRRRYVVHESCLMHHLSETLPLTPISIK